jgi:4-hydroxybenzoate polyprenyltransferase
VRAGEWWDYKLVPIFAAFYATAAVLQIPVSSLWLAALTVLLSIVPGAAYVSVINDVTDRADDAMAGKPNRVASLSRPAVVALVAFPIGAGLFFAFLWRDDVLLLSLYLAAWAAFSLYSLPPFRLKTRGIFGVLADACGAHLFPTLVSVVVVFRAAERPVRVPWLVIVGVWAFAYGLRGILFHQLSDRENDHHAAVRTFAARHLPHMATRLGAFIAFPLELAAAAAMVWQIRSLWPVVSLGLYALLAAVRIYRWRWNAVVVTPKPRFFVVLQEYYDFFLPIAILVASALQHPVDILALAVHLLVFPRRLGHWLLEVGERMRARIYKR